MDLYLNQHIMTGSAIYPVSYVTVFVAKNYKQYNYTKFETVKTILSLEYYV
jgi:hypothetical protein